MSERRDRICHWCGRQAPKKEYCQPCQDEFPNRPAPETMTADEREAEFRLLNWMEVPLALIKERITALLGRPFWSHEMGSAGFEALAKEVRWEGRPSTLEEILNRFPAGTEVILVAPGEGNDGQPS